MLLLLVPDEKSLLSTRAVFRSERGGGGQAGGGGGRGKGGRKQIKWRTGISSSHSSKYLDCARCHFHTDFPTVCNMHEDGKIRACILHSAGIGSILLSEEGRVTMEGHFYSLSPEKTGRMKHDVLVKHLNRYLNIRTKCRRR